MTQSSNVLSFLSDHAACLCYRDDGKRDFEDLFSRVWEEKKQVKAEKKKQNKIGFNRP